MDDAVFPELIEIDLGAGVRAAFTTRRGGVGQGNFAQANMSFSVGDDPVAVTHNRAALQQGFGMPVAFINQVHGTDVHWVDGVDAAAAVPTADAVITRKRGVGVAVQVADCAPVLLADAEAGLVAAVHVGRRGLLAGILPTVCGALAEAGARLSHVRAAIGPAVCGACYEVPAAMAREADIIVPGARTVTRQGSEGIDIPGAIERQLMGLGVDDIHNCNLCTVELPHLFSYRRADGRTGRQVGVIGLI